MRMRFWATIRSPAFSISALIAPVRLRAVASGLIIEKVRSIAMISSLRSAEGELRGLYRRRRRTASQQNGMRQIAQTNHRATLMDAPNYDNFTKMNPV